MNSLSLLWHVLWISRICLQAILLAVLVRRKFYREFPAFVLFTGWAVARGVALLAMAVLAMIYANFVSGSEYYQAYRIGAAVDAALSFAVLYELLKHILGEHPVLSGVGSSLYRWAILLLIVIALALAWFVPSTGPGSLMAKFYVLQRTARLLQCGLLVFLFVFARSFGLAWRSRAFGIALGFGVSATLSLAAAAIRTQIEPVPWNRTQDILTLIGQVSDFSGVLVWMACLLTRESTDRVQAGALPEHDLQSWNQELRRLLP